MNKYSIVELTKTGIIEVCSVRTIEEAYHMLKKWMDYKPEAKFDLMECT